MAMDYTTGLTKDLRASFVSRNTLYPCRDAVSRAAAQPHKNYRLLTSLTKSNLCSVVVGFKLTPVHPPTANHNVA